MNRKKLPATNRRTAPAPTAIEPILRSGAKGHWRSYTGTFLRNTVEGQAKALIGTRTYRLHKTAPRSA